MRIGIVGAGNVGRLYGRAWIGRGHDVAFSYARDTAALAAFVASCGERASAVAVEEVAAQSDVIVFSPPFERIDDAAARLGSVAGKTVIDTTNPFNPERTGLVDLGGSTAVARVVELLPGAHLVKALHNLSVQQAETAMTGDPAAVFVASDRADAADTAGRLIIDAGLLPFSMGDLASARWSEAPGPLFMNVYGLSEVSAAVAQLRA
ncbi:NADPH-dependent F420 reductase [Microbacterium sp.]|uniref:NADPH-dependent F420 reductase n=1 Tax=Microbacterium sp. TaxID=51671 RepID=UPI003C770A0D